MSVEKLEKAIFLGENIAIKFKRCGGNIEGNGSCVNANNHFFDFHAFFTA